MQVFYNKVYAFLYKSLHLQKVTWYQNWYDILNIKFGSSSIIKYLFLTSVVLVLLFEVLHEPLKYLDVTMHTDIDIIDRCGFCQILFEVLHVSYKQILFTCKILIDLPIFIEHMNHYNLLGFLAWTESSRCCWLFSSTCMLVYLSQSLHTCLGFLCVLCIVWWLSYQIRLSFLWRSVHTLLVVLYISECSLLITEAIEDVGCGWLLSGNCILVLHLIWIGYL